MAGLYVTAVVVHVLATSVWVGGAAFLGLVLVPVLRRPENRSGAGGLFARAVLRFRTVAWVCLALMVATGALTLHFRGVGAAQLGSGDFWRSSFGLVLAHKLALVLLILVAGAVNDVAIGPRALAQWQREPDSPRTMRLRRTSAWIGRGNLLLAVVVVVLAVRLARGAP